jgi:Protein of unknown function (DUF3108)
VREARSAIRRAKSEGRRISRAETVFLLAVLVLVAPAFYSLSAHPEQHAHPSPQRASDPAGKEQPVPFRAGEKLSYRVSWALFSSAASLELSAPERRDLFGREAWHFRGVAHTLNSVRTLFPIDDQFDSYTDAATLDSLQFETHLNEMGKSTSQVLHLAPRNEPSDVPPPIVIVPRDTRDPLGAVYSLRDVDWQRTPDFRAPVYDGHDLFEIRASLEASGESLKVAAGAYSTSRISIRVFQNQKEVSAVHYELWIARDAARTPVVMEATLPFGTIRAELTSAAE